MEIALHFVAALLVIVTALPFSHIKHWLVRSLDFPRLQIAVGLLTLLVAQLYLLNIREFTSIVWITMTLLCLLIQAWWILPYTLLWPREVASNKHIDPDLQISILTANVFTPNRNATALLKLVDELQPDILVTLESDRWWQTRLDVLETSMPYTIKCPLDNLYGMHVYSAVALFDTRIEFLVEDQVPSMYGTIKLPDGQQAHLHFVHPAPPSPTENTRSTQRDAELILIAKRVTDAPTIVTGDLNDVAWSSTTRLFRKISGLLDPRVGRGMFNTFHARYPMLRWPLDHIFHSHHFTLRRIKRLPSIDSDHFPLFVTLAYTPDNNRNKAALVSTEEDEQRAEKL